MTSAISSTIDEVTKYLRDTLPATPFGEVSVSIRMHGGEVNLIDLIADRKIKPDAGAANLSRGANHDNYSPR
jgi:hypothetical protein